MRVLTLPFSFPSLSLLFYFFFPSLFSKVILGSLQPLNAVVRAHPPVGGYTESNPKPLKRTSERKEEEREYNISYKRPEAVETYVEEGRGQPGEEGSRYKGLLR